MVRDRPAGLSETIGLLGGSCACAEAQRRFGVRFLPDEVSCACTETQLGVLAAARQWLIFLHCSHVCGPTVLIENNISIRIECENGINFGQSLARDIAAMVARSEKVFLFLMVFIGKPRSETKRGGGSRIILRSKPDYLRLRHTWSSMKRRG